MITNSRDEATLLRNVERIAGALEELARLYRRATFSDAPMWPHQPNKEKSDETSGPERRPGRNDSGA